MRGYLTGLRVTTGNRNLKTNPYEPAATESASAFPNEGTSLWKSVAVGDCSSIAWSFPITALLGLLFRFPVPFGTIEGGLDHVIPSLFALLFYGVFTGGFIVIGIGGVTVGLIVHFAAGRDSPAKLWAIFLLSALVPGFCLFVLAIPEQF
ncbi:MAG: hypothetical protein HKN47_10095 [Pirellulaceae bacterium]|nr:hypothetical protein [Pirellulaceae bacterium]